MTDARSQRRWFIAVVLLAGLLAALLMYLAHWRYGIFRYGVDLGIFTQVISSPATGFSSTVEASRNHLLAHWSPLIILAWPFLRAFGPVGLQYFQALMVVATLFPVWGLARARFSAPIAFAVVAVAALYPILWANAFGDFHEMAFVPLLSACLVYAFEKRQMAVAFAVALLLLCVKEDQFVILGVNAVIMAALRWRDVATRWFSVATLGAIAVIALLYFKVFHDILNPGVPYFSMHFFNWGAAQAAPSEPLSAFAGPRLIYALAILAPLAFLPLFSRYGLFMLIGAAEIFASHEQITLAPGAHYSALLTGYALAAFVDGAANVARRFPRVRLIPLAVAAAICIYVGIFASPMEYWYYLYRGPTAHDALLERTLQALPANADVGAEDEVFAHLGLDPNASIDVKNQQWFVYDERQYSDHWHNVDEPLVKALLAQRKYKIASQNDGIAVLYRTP